MAANTGFNENACIFEVLENPRFSTYLLKPYSERIFENCVTQKSSPLNLPPLLEIPTRVKTECRIFSIRSVEKSFASRVFEQSEKTRV